MKLETTIIVSHEYFMAKFALEEFLVGNDIEYHPTTKGNFKAWLTGDQIEQLRNDGYTVHVW